MHSGLRTNDSDAAPVHASHGCGDPMAAGLRAMRATGYGPADHLTTVGTTKGQACQSNASPGIIFCHGLPGTKPAHLAQSELSSPAVAKAQTAMINTSQHNLYRDDESLRQAHMSRNRRSEPTDLAPAIGLEPITCRLTAGRSAS